MSSTGGGVADKAAEMVAKKTSTYGTGLFLSFLPPDCFCHKTCISFYWGKTNVSCGWGTIVIK